MNAPYFYIRWDSYVRIEWVKNTTPSDHIDDYIL